MKKRFIKKIAVLGLAGALIIPTLVFADDTTNTTTNPTTKPALERPLKENPTDRPEKNIDRMPRGGERASGFEDRSLELVTLYAPELLGKFETAMDSQKSIRDSINTLQQSKMDTRQTEYKTLLNTLKEGLEAGTLTRTEAKTQLEAFKTSNQTEKDALRTELEALKDTYKIDQEAHKTLMIALKTAVDNNDEAAIKASLNTLLDGLNQHIQYDQAVYELFSSK